MSNTPAEPTAAPPKAPITYMDREGHRWTLEGLKPFWVPQFYQGTRAEDGVEVVVHLSDFQRTQKG